MIDLHTHTFLSDGALSPAELVRQAEVRGYRTIAITDHVDAANLSRIVRELCSVARHLNRVGRMRVLPGVELTHLPPRGIAEIAREARSLGAQIVHVHGETVSEPVAPGTNRAAILAGVDFVSHPGLISPALARLAAQRGIALEISAKRAHAYANGHVASVARRAKARLVLNSDGHRPDELLTPQFARLVVRGAGLPVSEYAGMQANARAIVRARTR